MKMRAKPRLLDLFCKAGGTSMGYWLAGYDVVGVESRLEGHSKVMVGMINDEIKITPMRNVWSRKKNIDYELLRLSEVLS